MNFYETVFIVRQDSTPAQVESLTQDYTKIIRDHSGEVSKTEICGLRTLAYAIKKNRKGHYVLMNIHSSPAGIAEMERVMKLNENVLRHLTVRVEALDPNPSSLMQQKNFQHDRARAFDDDQDDIITTTETESA